MKKDDQSAGIEQESGSELETWGDPGARRANLFKGGFFLNHLLDGPFTGPAPFARQPIE